VKVAYLTSQYPKVSHTFIRREIAGVEAAGIEVLRVSVRRSREQFVDWRDRAELEKTRVLLDGGVRGLLRAVASTLVRQPLRTLRALRLAVVMGWKAPQGLARHLAYLAEACLLLRLAARRARGLPSRARSRPTRPMWRCCVASWAGPPSASRRHRTDRARLAVGFPRSSARSRRRASWSRSARRDAEDSWRSPRQQDAGKIGLVRCGVDAHFLRAAATGVPESPRLVCVARLSPRRAVFVLLRARADPGAGRTMRFELSLLGDGPDRPELEARGGAPRPGHMCPFRGLGQLRHGRRAHPRLARARAAQLRRGACRW
jgi:hypothetical protein